MAHTASTTVMLQSARPFTRPFTSTAIASPPPSQCRSKAERLQTLSQVRPLSLQASTVCSAHRHPVDVIASDQLYVLLQRGFCLGPKDLSQTRRSAAGQCMLRPVIRLC